MVGKKGDTSEDGLDSAISELQVAVLNALMQPEVFKVTSHSADKGDNKKEGDKREKGERKKGERATRGRRQRGRRQRWRAIRGRRQRGRAIVEK